MVHTASLQSSDVDDIDSVGGKGRNLMLLSRAGFRVPPGYVVLTDAYRAFIDHNALAEKIIGLTARMDVDAPEDVEEKTAQIRALLERAEIPPRVEESILSAYSAMGEQSFVAVRSSGTAEDLAEASFAGQHDTFLDVRGPAALLAAVRACWASLWSARATSYRQRKGFDHSSVSIAVVVQEMVAAEVSGVMFTANPMTAAVDETVINASWGLGEAVVSGLVTPDQFVLQRDTLQVQDRLLGTKEQCIRRDPLGGATVTESVPEQDRARYTLTDQQLGELGMLGRRVAQYYDDFPQDIEWAYLDGKFYLLQSREITGVDFTWGEDLATWNTLQPPAPEGTIWTRKFSDAVWTGKKTPLGYSIRDEVLNRLVHTAVTMWGLDDVAETRFAKYYKGEIYCNPTLEYLITAHLIPPVLRRPELLAFAPESWFSDLEKESFSWTKLAKAAARIQLVDPVHGPWKCWKNLYDQMETAEGKAAGDGLPQEQIQLLSDAELKRYLDSRIMAQKEWVEDMFTMLYLILPTATAALSTMVEKWYKGDNPMILSDLITGIPELTITLKENIELWKLAERIRNSDELRRLFSEHEGRAFFDELENHDAGTEFLAEYRKFLAEFGFRGHADRDIHFDRRIENPAIDYNNFKSLLTMDKAPPQGPLRELIAQREAAEDEMIASIRRQPLSALKIEAFKLVQSWLLRFFQLRDDERHHTDRITFSKKRAVLEISRRLVDRGVLAGDDVYFMGKNELYELLDGNVNMRLVQAKISARRRYFDTIYTEYDPPMYLKGNIPVDLDAAAAAEGSEGLFTGLGTSRGCVTGIARIVPSQADIARVRKGDIMIATATDPGWTPVFLVISGLVLESGGVLAHGSCISREYGIPAVQLSGARRLIKDGATISVNGDTGEVRVIAEPEEMQSLETPAAEPVSVA